MNFVIIIFMIKSAMQTNLNHERYNYENPKCYCNYDYYDLDIIFRLIFHFGKYQIYVPNIHETGKWKLHENINSKWITFEDIFACHNLLYKIIIFAECENVSFARQFSIRSLWNCKYFPQQLLTPHHEDLEGAKPLELSICKCEFLYSHCRTYIMNFLLEKETKSMYWKRKCFEFIQKMTNCKDNFRDCLGWWVSFWYWKKPKKLQFL